MLKQLAVLHARSQKSFAHLAQHKSGPFTDGYDEIMTLGAAYDRMMPVFLDAIARPVDQPPVTRGRRPRGAW